MAPAHRAGVFTRTGRGSSAAPGFNVHSKIAPSPPLTRRRRGGRAMALRAARQIGARCARTVSTTLRRKGRGLRGYASACCGRLCQSLPSSTLTVRAWSSRRTVHRHAARPLAMELSTPRLNHEGRLPAARGVLALSLAVVLARVRARAGEAVMRGGRVSHISFRERVACASLACRESWRGHGCALGFMAATFQRKQFPLRCAHSSWDKFFSLPGSPLRCDRQRCDPLIPRRPVHNKDALARPCSTRKEKHHG